MWQSALLVPQQKSDESKWFFGSLCLAGATKLVPYSVHIMTLTSPCHPYTPLTFDYNDKEYIDLLKYLRENSKVHSIMRWYLYTGLICYTIKKADIDFVVFITCDRSVTLDRFNCKANSEGDRMEFSLWYNSSIKQFIEMTLTLSPCHPYLTLIVHCNELCRQRDETLSRIQLFHKFIVMTLTSPCHPYTTLTVHYSDINQSS